MIARSSYLVHYLWLTSGSPRAGKFAHSSLPMALGDGSGGEGWGGKIKSLTNKEVMKKKLDIAWACGTATFNQAVLKAKF